MVWVWVNAAAAMGIVIAKTRAIPRNKYFFLKLFASSTLYYHKRRLNEIKKDVTT
jgi:hypothetical protein